jgi:MoaA/NifB/PqqE/SkfB family radical SAM enzyme
MKDLLYKYQNGNVIVSLYEDGTKVQEWDDNEIPIPIFPNSMDIKITNYCDANCKFCHEMSTTRGRHGNLDLLLSIIKDLPPGTELALGGGNPLDYPGKIKLLKECKRYSLVPNMTINSKHILQWQDTLNDLINDKLIYGVGISITDDFNLKHLSVIENPSNVVLHVIAGVNNIHILDEIKNTPFKKVLILGYKEVGRGIGYYNQEVKDIKRKWYNKISDYIGEIHLSFDNLAIEQLKVKRFFTPKSWKKFFMGEEGQFTMYMDMVNEEFAVSSTSIERYKIEGNIKEMFHKVRTVSNFE